MSVDQDARCCLVNKTFLKGHVWRGEKLLNDFGECDSTVTSVMTTTYIAHPNIFFRRLAIVFAPFVKNQDIRKL